VLARAALAVLVAALLLTLASPAGAHAVGLSRGAYDVQDGVVRADLTFARADVVALVPGLDSRGEGVVSRADVERARAELERVIVGGVSVSADAQACAPHLEAATLTEQDGLEIVGRYECPKGAHDVGITIKLLDELSGGHRHIAHATGAIGVDAVCFRGQADFHVPVPSAVPGAAAPEVKSPPSWHQFLWMGVEHILTGYDHLVFLFGLVLLGGRPRAIVLVITAFTVAHSITLALATLGVWAPSPRIVEPAIALSIAYVGAENFFVATAERRWRITFPFGLIHGFGFAGALREIGLPTAQVPVALVLFNLGVEAGQLAVLALVLPLIYWLRRYEWFRGMGVRVLSGAILLVGVFWFLNRVWGG